MKSSAELCLQAQLSLQSGNIETAYKDSFKAIQLDASNFEAYLIFGNACNRAGRPNESLRAFKAAVKLDAKRAEAWHGLAISLFTLGQVSAAQEAAEKTCELSPSNPEYHLLLGTIHLALGHWEAAQQSFRTATVLAPEQTEAWYNLGFALRKSGKYPEAVDALRRSLSLRDQNAAALFELGLAFLQSGEADESRRTFAKAVQAVTTPAEGLILARHFREERLGDEAVAAYRKTLSLDQTNADAWQELSHILQSLGRFGEADQAAQQTLTLRPHDAAALYRLALIFTSAEEAEKLARQIQAALKDAPPPEVETLNYALGKVFNDLGRFEAASHAFDQANQIAFQIRRRGERFDAAGYQRMFQAVIEKFNHSFLELARPLSNPSEMPILIVGMPRSGTTLIEQILTAHPSVAGGSELPFWLQGNARELLFEKGARLNGNRTDSIAQQYLQLLMGLSNGRPRVTDKQPNNYMAAGLALAIFPNCRIVHCRRNPADNCLSIYQTPFQDPPEYAFVKSDIAAAYRLYLKVTAHWRATLPKDRFMEIDYEDLVLEGEPRIRGLVEFCGLPWDDRCLDFQENQRFVNTPSSWQVRQPLYASSVGRWQRYRQWTPEFGAII